MAYGYPTPRVGVSAELLKLVISMISSSYKPNIDVTVQKRGERKDGWPVTLCGIDSVFDWVINSRALSLWQPSFFLSPVCNHHAPTTVSGRLASPLK